MKRNKFSLSNERILSFRQGQLVPINLTEVLPGDTFQASTQAFLRAAPLVTPVMASCIARIEHWFVPTRLIWDDFEDFITGGPDGDDASVPPHFIWGPGFPIAPGTLADYLGLPTGARPSNQLVSALPFRAYALIFNEWYRDQDLVTPLAISTGSGHDMTTSQALQYRAWEKDYFTTTRLEAQKGPSVTLPLGSTAPVVSNGLAIGVRAQASAQNINLRLGPAVTAIQSLAGEVGTGAVDSLQFQTGVNGSGDAYSGLEADLSAATAVDINDVRRAFAIQRLLEARARFGSRYTEYLAYLGVIAADARLQRPEYLGGGRNTMQFSEVLQTAEGTNPVGTMKGHGVGAMRSNRYRKHFQEHGYVLSLMSVMPRTVYMNALPRHWSRTVKEDYWQKELQHIGQQEVLNKEVQANSSNGEGIFGYQDRYDEYRRAESGVSGEFRTTLNTWHMARDFGTADVVLNSSFVQANPTNRVYASTDTDQIYARCQNKIVARRMVARDGSSFIS